MDGCNISILNSSFGRVKIIQRDLHVNFEIHNQCTYKVWAASLNLGGDRAIESGKSWLLSVVAGQKAGRIWGRTSCSFGPDRKGSYKTGDCGDLLNCQGSGAILATLVGYTLNAIDGNKDIYDISLWLMASISLFPSHQPTVSAPTLLAIVI
eukprot:Gb_19745 [translate_table: standard]